MNIVTSMRLEWTPMRYGIGALTNKNTQNGIRTYDYFYQGQCEYVFERTSSNLLNAVAALECKHAAKTWDTTWPPLHEHMRLTEKERESFTINTQEMNKELQQWDEWRCFSQCSACYSWWGFVSRTSCWRTNAACYSHPRLRNTRSDFSANRAKQATAFNKIHISICELYVNTKWFLCQLLQMFIEIKVIYNLFITDKAFYLISKG